MENKAYEEFVEKFKPKKTTDDCYTPPAVYDVVLNYVKEKCNIEGLRVLRPFYPNGDYENETYDDNCVVIDNPPFSIISQIIRFYNERNVKYFLFAPHLTLFSSDQDYTAVVSGASIIYENGAKVPTSFVSNLFGDIKILGDSYLHERLKQTQGESKKCLPRYVYPDNLITVADVAKIVAQGGFITIHKKEVAHCRALESQKPFKKAIFGGGFIMSDKATIRMKAEQMKAKKEITIWKLSDREKEFVKTLG